MWTGHRVREGVLLGGMWSKRVGLGPTVEVRRRRNGAGRDMTAELGTIVGLGMPAELGMMVGLGMPAELGSRVGLGRRVGLDPMA